MEVVCLILGPMLVSQPCLHAFCVLTSLHLSFLLKMFLLFLFLLVFFLDGAREGCKLYIMQSRIH